MATVYIKPGTGTGTGSQADPYFYSQLATAETAAGSGGTILFTDGTYSVSTNVVWDADGVTYKSENKHLARIVASTNSHVFLVGSTSITAPVIADGFFVQDLSLKPTSPNQTADANKTCKYLNIKLEQTAQHSLNPITHPSADALALFEVNFCELNFHPPASTRPFAGCNGGTMTNCSVFLNLDDTTGFSTRSSGTFGSFTNCIIASNDTTNSKCTQNSPAYSTDATNCLFHQLGTQNESGGTNNISGDPLFITPGSDLRLRPNSPAIGAS
jgi:hypothetical protein